MLSIKELRRVCQNSKEAPSWRTQSAEGRINRIFSIYLTWIFVHFSFFSPNLITLLGTLIYLGGACFFISNGITLQITGLVLIFLSFVLDACDGEVARWKPVSGGLGGLYIEPVSHDIMYAFFFLPLGIGALFAAGTPYPLIAAFLASASKLVFRLLECRQDLIWARKKMADIVPETVQAKTPNFVFYTVYRNFSTNTGMFFVLIVAVILRRIDWFLYTYAAAYFLFLCYKFINQWRKLKKMA